MILGDAEGVAKPLVMHDLPLPQELDRISHVGVIAETENVVVGHAGFLLCYYHAFATKSGLATVRKILILQRFSAFFQPSVFQKFQ